MQTYPMYAAVQDLQGKTRKETTPTIIDDTLIIIDLDTKTGLDTQSQDATVTKTPNNLFRPGTRGALYTDPIARPPPKPPELRDKRKDPRQHTGRTPNLDFEENSPHREVIIVV